MYTGKFQSIVKASGVEAVRLPPRSPNLNANAGRFVSSIKEECLNHLILSSEEQLRHVLSEYLEHYHHERIHQGTHKITGPLDKAGLSEHSGYFHTHERRMQYQTFLDDGYPIGSGTVESGVKCFKHRLTGAGMRWSRHSAEEMLVLRGAALTGTFDQLWDAA